jgi:hypothetical protein
MRPAIFIGRAAPLLLCVLVTACPGRPVEDGLEGRAVAALAPAPTPPPSAPLQPGAALDPTRPSIRFAPERLRVYRATPVRLAALPPADVDAVAWEGAVCRWTFGDGSPPLEGCTSEHVFARGTSDEEVTLSVTFGETTLRASRILPLERLPVRAARPDEEAAASGVPAAPAPGPSSFRMVFLAGTDLPDVAVSELVTRIRGLRAELVVHLGQAVEAGGEGFDAWERLRDELAEPLREDGIPLVWALSPSDLAADPLVRRPAVGLLGDALELAEGSEFPRRYAFAFKGVYFAVLSGTEQDAENLAWLRARLSEARVHPSRVVLSHAPLHPFSARTGPLLGPKFKLYELLLRARVSLLASAAHGVFFDGRYGALPVLSVAGSGGPGVALAGHDFPQPPSLAVVDIEDGALVRTFAVPLSGEAAVLDSAYLPETVEVYTR